MDSFYVYDTPADSNYRFQQTIPYAGLVWDLQPQLSAFASFTSIFKPQNNRDTQGHYLDPVDGRSFEVGLKGEHFGRQLNSAVTLVETRQNNVAGPLLDPNGEPILLPDGSQVSQAVDGTRTRGFEIELAGQLSSQWRGAFGWTRYLTQDGNVDAFCTFIPSTLVRLFATWEPRDWIPGLSLGGGVNWQSASSTLVGTPPDASGEPTGGTMLRQGSLTQVSLMARYRFSPNASIQFNANNVLDKKYYVLDEYDNTYYGAPASYALGLRLQY